MPQKGRKKRPLVINQMIFIPWQSRMKRNPTKESLNEFFAISRAICLLMRALNSERIVYITMKKTSMVMRWKWFFFVKQKAAAATAQVFRSDQFETSNGTDNFNCFSNFNFFIVCKLNLLQLDFFDLKVSFVRHLVKESQNKKSPLDEFLSVC